MSRKKLAFGQRFGVGWKVTIKNNVRGATDKKEWFITKASGPFFRTVKDPMPLDTQDVDEATVRCVDCLNEMLKTQLEDLSISLGKEIEYWKKKVSLSPGRSEHEREVLSLLMKIKQRLKRRQQMGEAK